MDRGSPRDTETLPEAQKCLGTQHGQEGMRSGPGWNWDTPQPGVAGAVASKSRGVIPELPQMCTAAKNW